MLRGACCSFLLLFAAALGLASDPPQIVGPERIDPYKVVRLSVTGLDGKAGVLWKVEGADPKAVVDYGYGGNRKRRDVEFVAPPGEYTVSLTVVTIGSDGTPQLDELTKRVTIGKAEPPVPPVPPTPVADNPFGALPGLHVLIVYETADAAKLPSGQFLILQGKKTRDYLDGKCAADGYRILDKDVKPAADEWWVKGMKRGDHAKQLPWVYVGKENTGYSGPLPADPDAFITLLAKYAGN
jgi:hypothetical protein